MPRRHLVALAALGALSACSLSSPDAGQAASSAAITNVSATKAAPAKNKAASSYAAAKAKKKKVHRKASKISVRALPQISQPGKKAASASKALAVVDLTVSPRRTTLVTLQYKSGKKWKKAKSATTTSNGKHQFKTGVTRGGKPATYRVVVGKKKSKAVSMKSYVNPTFTDNFTRKSLGKNWSNRGQGYNPSGLRKCSKGSPKAVKVTGATLRLSVMKDPAKKNKKCKAMREGKSTGKYNYRLNGHVSTENNFSFKHGFAAARIKFPRHQGQHAAFWMQPQTPEYRKSIKPKNTGAEIDVIESFGEGAGPQGRGANGLTSFTHHPTGTLQNLGSKKTGDWLKNTDSYLASKNDSWFSRYHVFSVEWTPTKYTFRIDGKTTWTSKKAISGKDQFLIFSLLSSDYELHALGKESRLPQHMYVDWVRVWEK